MTKPLKLDIAKFRKVRALMERGSTEGERQAARSRAKAIAEKACMTLDAAIREDDRLQKQDTSRHNSRTSWSADDLYRAAAENLRREQEERDRQEKEQWAAYWEAEEKKRKARFDEAVRKYGPAEPVFAETPQEMRLRTFLEPYATYAKYSNSDELYIDGYIGWGKKYPNPAAFRKLMNEAIPLPTDLPGLIAEWDFWEELKDRRYAYESEYEAPRHVWARTDILEDLIRVTPVRHWQDMDVRLKWMEAELDRDRWRDREKDREEFDRLKADLEFLRSGDAVTRPAAPIVQNGHAQNGHRTNADKATAVRDILTGNPELSDRAIGRMAGVSPQTVTNWRNRLGLSRAAA